MRNNASKGRLTPERAPRDSLSYFVSPAMIKGDNEGIAVFVSRSGITLEFDG